jgi:hypothetical protein
VEVQVERGRKERTIAQRIVGGSEKSVVMRALERKYSEVIATLNGIVELYSQERGN